MSKDIRVLLYYKYVPIENGAQFAADHLEFCKSIGLKGRILVADEGNNSKIYGLCSFITRNGRFMVQN